MDKLDQLLKKIQSNSDRCIALQDGLSELLQPEVRSWKLSELGEFESGRIDGFLKTAIVRSAGRTAPLPFDLED
jgi:hypothetical protein